MEIQLIMETINMKISADVLEKGMDYTTYRNHIHELFENGKVTGHEQHADYLEYTKMNEQRMRRWDKQFVPSLGMVEAMALIRAPRTWLVITEGWCGDSAQIVPAIEKIALQNPLVRTRYLLRDENDGLMAQFLTNGKRSIPILACLDEHGTVLWKWGPYPNGAAQLIAAAKAAGTPKEVWKKDLHLWYARNMQHDLQDELSILIASEEV